MNRRFGCGIKALSPVLDDSSRRTRTHLGLAKDPPLGRAVQRTGTIVTCPFSKHYPPEKLCRWAVSDSLKFMTAWRLQWLSGVRERLRQRRDLLLELIVLRHQLAVLQRTGTRRPCFRTGERLFWVFLSRWWANWQRSLIIVQPATVLRWRRRGFWA